MENASSEEKKIIKDIRHFFRLKKEVKGIKDVVLRIAKNLFEYEKEEEDYHKPVRVNIFWDNSYIKYKTNGN